jgi:hypothetical protein
LDAASGTFVFGVLESIDSFDTPSFIPGILKDIIRE